VIQKIKTDYFPNSLNQFIFIMEVRCILIEVGNEFLNIILRSLHSVHEQNSHRADSVCTHDSRTAGRILMKFGMNVMPLETTPTSFITIRNTKMANSQTYEVATPLEQPNTGSRNDVGL
jgi:hypothetical protein